MSVLANIIHKSSVSVNAMRREDDYSILQVKKVLSFRVVIPLCLTKVAQPGIGLLKMAG